MKQQRHKHKESFSILLISHTGRESRQFHISLFSFRLFLLFLLLLCVLIGYAVYCFLQSDSGREDLLMQIASRDQTIADMEKEKTALKEEADTLEQEKLILESELDTMRNAIAAGVEKAEAQAAEEEGPQADTTFPSLYPSTGSGILVSSYSEEQPYISISAHSEGSIIAAGDGTVSAITSDDTYPQIIEVTHASGYTTRYMCRQETELKTQEGAQVLAGDTLLTITTNETQLDYQVILNNEPVDPLTVIEAKG
jgi:murein DD-endopeptidase MepM/ murein hydrolase activator NlpD